ncbi:MAG: hypothetical protein HQL31_13960, partial [Planctomycetes bacterium]|nr:hypothetical protein [Planctomycetota bacterium]
KALIIDTAPFPPGNLEVYSLAFGNVTHSHAPEFRFTLSDPDSANTVSYRIEIDNDDTGAPAVDYRSALSAQGNAAFTVGQAPAGGLYSIGSSGQSLPSGNYSWRTSCTDLFGLSSSAAMGNAFLVNNPPVVGGMSPNSPLSFFRLTSPPSFDFTLSDADGDLVGYTLSVSPPDTSFTVTGSGPLAAPGNRPTAIAAQTYENSYSWTVEAFDIYGSTHVLTAAAPAFYVNAEPDEPGTLLPGLEIYYDTPTSQFVSFDPTVTISLIYNNLLDPNLDDLQFQVQIAKDASFSSPTVDYVTDFVDWITYISPVSFTVGQPEGSGTYMIGSFAQILSSGLYHFRARALDAFGPGPWQTGDYPFLVNRVPLAPTVLNPGGDIFVNTLTPTLSFFLDDPEDDLVRFHVTVEETTTGNTVINYYSEMGTEGARSFTVGTAAGNTASDTDAYYVVAVGITPAANLEQLPAGNGYIWRVEAIDIWATTPVQSTAAFTDYAFNTSLSPLAPLIFTPENGATTDDSTPDFSFSIVDPDFADSVGYQLQIATDNLFAGLVYDTLSGFQPQGNLIYTPPAPLAKGAYYWRVRAFDTGAFFSAYTVAAGGNVAFIVNQRPSDPIPLSPIDAPSFVLGFTTPALSFTLEDDDGDPVAYRVQISPTSDFSIIEVDYQSALPAPGNTFSIGQAAGAGTYIAGGPNQAL